MTTPALAPANPSTLFDERPISSGQWRIIMICSLMSMIDGFDLQTIAFAAPSIQAEWKLDAALLGPVFSAGLLGGMVGGFLIGPLTDRVGPRRVLLISAIVIGLSSLATMLATNVVEMLALRAVTGIAIGAASPAIVALLSAFSPRRVRATLVTVAFCTQLLGAFLGSMASAALLNSHGWQSIFLVGGVLPLVLVVPLIWLYVPEPLAFLARRGAAANRISHALALSGHEEVRLAPSQEASPSPQRPNNSALALFADGRARETSMLLLTCLTGGTFFYFLASWLPMILRQDGATIETAVYGSTALNLGGLVGSILFSRLIDQYSPYPIMICGYFVGAIIIAAIAFVEPGIHATIAMIGVASLFGLGAQYCIPAVVVLIYPERMHGAGTGFALGFARIGAVAGPLVGSYILLVGGGASDLFLFASIVALAAATCVFVAHRMMPDRSARVIQP